jgi:hypothetical protein|tara:strand:- start:1077 stop:1274 length:198 start_codon:yes stop_codon:yes gene_type:complete
MDDFIDNHIKRPSVLIENDEEEEYEIDGHDPSIRERMEHIKQEPSECPSPATLGKNIDNIIVKNK